MSREPRNAVRPVVALPVLALLGLLVPLLVTASPAAGAEPTTITLGAARGYADRETTLDVTLAATAAPVVGATVTLERRVDGVWTPLASVVTDGSGTASQPVTLSRDPRDNRVRATYAGDATYDPARATYDLRLRKREGRVTLDGPSSFVDERSAPLEMRWTTRGGEPVEGRVYLERREDGRWKQVQRLRTNDNGWARTRVSPRTDSRWRARARSLPWVTGDRSGVHVLDNLPPGVPVRLPDAAPRPRRHLPPQPHAVGDGANPAITRIPDGMWRQMAGITWHAGCPVGRAGLRLLRINYWDYQGYRRRGELVAAAGVIGQMSRALTVMYAEKLPLRSMYRVDRFGWSDRLHGGDDYASMAAGNTSAFNCRDVVGRPGVRSPHSWGRSLDVNTWENPYRSPQGLVPNAWWQSHSHPRVAWRSRSHRVVEIMRNHGLRWTYGLSDTQHFDAVPPGGRLLRVPGCVDVVCD